VVCPGKAGFPNGFAAFGAGPVATKPVDVQASPKLKIYFGEARAEGTSAVKERRVIQAERIVKVCELHCEALRLFKYSHRNIRIVHRTASVCWSDMTVQTA